MGCASERKSPVPEKKQKLSTKSKVEKSASARGKYFCLECLEDSLLDKKEEKFAAICRSDSSSVARHKAVRNRCARPSNEGILNVNTTSDSNTTECSETSAKTCSKEQQQNAFNVNKNGDKEDAVIILPNVHAQTTLLSFKQGAQKSQTEKDLSLKNVMDAIAGLSLKVDHLGQQHSTMERLVFEDCNVRTAVMAMREARNIFR